MQTRIRSFHTVLWGFLAAAQILFLCAVSWRAGGAVLDYDAAKAFTHMIAIWESGTLIVPEWQYITTMELDCAVLLALPFYGLTRDVLLAFWCANVLLLAMWAALIGLLMRRMGAGTARAAQAVLFVLLPYELSLTGYWNMMFLNASQYAFKVMLPLLCAALLLGPDCPRHHDWALLFIYLAGCTLTALSSGVYVAACGLAPVYGVGIYEWLQGRLRGTSYRLACLIGGAAVTLAGVAVQAYLGISTNASSMTLNSLSTIRDNTVNCLIGFFRLFGAMPADNPAVFSVSGIAALLRMALVCGLLGLAFWFLLRVLSGTLPSCGRRGIWPRYSGGIWPFCWRRMRGTAIRILNTAII